MSIDQGAVKLTVKNRAYKLTIDVPGPDADPTITILRETLWADEKGNVVKVERGNAMDCWRSYKDIAEQKFEFEGVGVNGTQLAGLIRNAADVFRKEDMERRAAEG